MRERDAAPQQQGSPARAATYALGLHRHHHHWPSLAPPCLSTTLKLSLTELLPANPCGKSLRVFGAFGCEFVNQPIVCGHVNQDAVK
ncbi:MAG: hypothetical protein EBT03_08790 [Betaproteobacteria bacterium]|nr:hypothetical protein [Betaproteobacteria bacterium]NCA17513.1 hypothetical protein [Betaproteobacteria bacterium]